jgi:hypothetical protein
MSLSVATSASTKASMLKGKKRYGRVLSVSMKGSGS